MTSLVTPIILRARLVACPLMLVSTCHCRRLAVSLSRSVSVVTGKTLSETIGLTLEIIYVELHCGLLAESHFARMALCTHAIRCRIIYPLEIRNDSMLETQKGL